MTEGGGFGRRVFFPIANPGLKSEEKATIFHLK
jgi:hypothetical protein